MTAVLAPTRDWATLTAAERTRLLTGPDVLVDAGVDLLDSSLNFTEALDVQIDTGSDVQWAGLNTVHRSCDVIVALIDELAWGNVLLRVWQSLTDTVSGLSARRNLGVFCPHTPDRVVGPVVDVGGVSMAAWSIAGQDRLYLLDRQVGASYVVPAGTGVLEAVGQVFTDAGLGSVLIDSTAAAAVIPSGQPMTWPLLSSFAAGSNANTDDTGGAYTWLRVVNDLLALINYRGVWCVAAGTLVTTDRGDIPIEQIRADRDRVWTRLGWRSVTKAWRTKTDAETLLIKTADRHAIEVTSDHLIWTEECGWIQARNLRPGMTVSSVPSQDRPHSSSGADAAGTAAPRPATTPTAPARCSTSPSGNARTGAASRRGRSSIILTTIRAITLWTISASSLSASILKFTGSSGSARRPRAGSGLARRRASGGRTVSRETSNVQGAASYSSQQECARDSAPRLAAQPSVVFSVEPSGRRVDVYDLTVEGAHEFYAGGILVHNCDENGFYRCVPYVDPSVAAPVDTFDADDETTSTVEPLRTRSRDQYQAPNRWIGVRSNMPDGTVPAVDDGIYIKNNVDDGPSSQTERNGQIWPVQLQYDVTDQDTLVALVEAQAAADLRAIATLQITTAPYPCAGHFDVFNYRDKALDAPAIVQAMTWRVPIFGGPVEWTLQEV